MRESTSNSGGMIAYIKLEGDFSTEELGLDRKGESKSDH
jgi:hypothetical protein